MAAVKTLTPPGEKGGVSKDGEAYLVCILKIIKNQKDTKQIKPPSCQPALKINADVIKIKDLTCSNEALKP